ncbi:MAG TPA: hypothetical protein VMP68_24100 [Candidatus Eisenbacteria bacterium]|nr:hypothetical protein [Candidatus Eisenbacteria bacterium]
MSIAQLKFLRVDLRRAGIPAILALAFMLNLTPRAAAQAAEFTLAPSALSPDAVAPGGVSSTSIQVQSQTGFTGTVDFTCQVTSTIATTDTPVCTVAPGSVTTPGFAIANLTTKATTTQTLYSVTITGTDPATSFTTTTSPQNFTVLAVTPQFTITIASVVAPSSVVAGSGAQGVVSVNAANGYQTPKDGGITLACGSISPLVTIAPVCSFTYPNSTNPKFLTLNGGTAGIGNLTISTFGPVTTGSLVHRRNFYAVWLSLPLLGFAGIGVVTGNKRSRKAWAVIAIFILTGSLLLIPACGTNTTATTSSPNGITPANTYTFTIVGVDSNGVVSSNVSATNTGPTVTLTVTAPPK